MEEAIIAAIAAVIVGVMTTISNIAVSNASQKKQNELFDFKIEQYNKEIKADIQRLEAKQDKHNEVIERTFKLEEHTAVIDEQIRVANHRIADLETITNKKK